MPTSYKASSQGGNAIKTQAPRLLLGGPCFQDSQCKDAHAVTAVLLPACSALTAHYLPPSPGFTLARRHYLHIEEAAFLVDRADLLLFVEAEEDEEDEEEGAGAAREGKQEGCVPWPGQP